MSFRIPPLAAALALGLGTAPLSPVAAQSAVAERSTRLALTQPLPPGPAAARLKAAYRLHLSSLWPQTTAGEGCRNGGEETLDGVLTRSADGTYSGRFARRTELLFCGAHGPAADGCSLVLTGRGDVDMAGTVLEDETSPSGRSVRVTWTPAPGHEAQVTGRCDEEFKQAVREMYLSTAHAAEFPLTTEGSAPRTERLEAYAWRVEVK